MPHVGPEARPEQEFGGARDLVAETVVHVEFGPRVDEHDVQFGSERAKSAVDCPAGDASDVSDADVPESFETGLAADLGDPGALYYDFWLLVFANQGGQGRCEREK